MIRRAVTLAGLGVALGVTPAVAMPLREASPASPRATTDAFTATSCPPGVGQGLRARLRCGDVRVPARYDVAGSATIRLAVVVVRAATPRHADPVLLLSGGPGEPLTRDTAFLASPHNPLSRLARTRDLVLLDQRGVGRSRPSLGCREEAEASNAGSAAAFARLALRVYGACADRLRRRGIDLDAYRTANNVRDLDAVRAALGYRRVNLFGTSYGARLALQALRGNPAWVRSAILASPIPAEENFLEDVGPSFASALNRTWNLCNASPGCRRRYPNLRGRFTRATERLARRPAHVRVPVPGTDRTVPYTVDIGAVATLVHAMYYSAPGIAALPTVLDAVARSRWTTLFGPATAGAARASLTAGMTLSVLCAEEAADADPARIAASLRGLPVVARALVQTSPIIGPPLFPICRRWDVPRAEAALWRPVAATTPALVVTGQLDQVTPPRYGRMTAAGLTNARYVEVPGVGHSPVVAGGTCTAALVQRFLKNPAAAIRPARCVSGT